MRSANAATGTGEDSPGFGLDAEFRSARATLWSVAYRLTGDAADADEVLQDTFVRALERRRPPSPWQPWLLRVATNRSLDLLRKRKRRGAYAGPWLPSPIEADTEPRVPSVEGRYELLESATFAFLLALEALGARQRAVLILRDVFDYAAAEVAVALGTTEANVRVLHLRARRQMERYDRERRPLVQEASRQSRDMLERFLACLARQDVPGVEALLADSVRTITDAGGAYSALRRVVSGRARVSAFHLKTARYRAPRSRVEIRILNGLPAAVIDTATVRPQQAPRIVLRVELNAGGRIAEIHSVLAPRKLAALRPRPA